MGSKKGSRGSVSVGEWIVTFIVLAIPLVNIIMLFVWAFGGGVNLSKKNYAKATLILIVISIALSFIMFSVIGTSIGTLFNNL